MYRLSYIILSVLFPITLVNYLHLKRWRLRCLLPYTLHKNRQERCHPLGWLMNCRNLLLTNFCNYFTLKLLKRNFLLQKKKIKIGGAIKNTECLEQTSAEISTSWNLNDLIAFEFLSRIVEAKTRSHRSLEWCVVHLLPHLMCKNFLF